MNIEVTRIDFNVSIPIKPPLFSGKGQSPLFRIKPRRLEVNLKFGPSGATEPPCARVTIEQVRSRSNQPAQHPGVSHMPRKTYWKATPDNDSGD